MPRIVILTTGGNYVTLKIDDEEIVTITTPITLYTDNAAVSFIVDGQVYYIKPSDTITINGVVQGGNDADKKAAVVSVLTSLSSGIRTPKSWAFVTSGDTVMVNGQEYPSSADRILVVDNEKVLIEVDGEQIELWVNIDTITINNVRVEGSSLTIANAMKTSVFSLPMPSVTPKIYKANISQVGTGQPSVTVLQNTTGRTFTWFRQAQGKLYCNISGDIIPINKVHVQSSLSPMSSALSVLSDYIGENQLELWTQDDAWVDVDLNNTTGYVGAYITAEFFE